MGKVGVLCEAHSGLGRARNTNLSVLASKNMGEQRVLIELLSVLLLLQPHFHFSSTFLIFVS